MENKENNELVFEDISSSSPSSVKKTVKQAGKMAKETARQVKKVGDDYGNYSYGNIDKIIKIIAFVVAIGVFLLFTAGAVVVFLLDSSLVFLSALIVLVGTVFSLIFLYLIYAQGYIISQNKEILKRLGK